MKRTLLALLLVPAIAHAQPKTADDFWKEGEKQYVLQKWDEAAAAFLEGYNMEADEGKKPSYLFNVAQSYRMGKRCKKSRFYYQQYLDARRSKPLKPEKVKEVEGRLAELEGCAKQEELDDKAAADKAAADKAAADKAAADKLAKRDKQVAIINKPEQPEEPEEPEDLGPDLRPTTYSARFVVGGAMTSAGSLEIPLRTSLAVIGGKPISVGKKLSIEAGGALALATAGYDDRMTSKTAVFTSLLANAGFTYSATSKIGVRVDVGAGLLVMSGASESPFTGYAKTTGALSMFNVRGGLGVDYALNKNLVITVPVAYSLSPAKDGVVSSIKRLDFMVGVGYRM